MTPAHRIALVALDNSKVRSWGGKHVHQELLERSMTERGWKVFPIYPPLGPAARRSGSRWRAIVKRILPWGHFAYFRWDVLRRGKFLQTELKKIVETEGVDWISCQDVPSALAAITVREAFPKMPIRVILTLHGYFGREAVNSLKPARSVVSRFAGFCKSMEIQALAGVDSVVCVDSRLESYIRDELGFSGRATLLHNCIDSEKFSPPSSLAEINRLRAELKLPTNAAIVWIPRRLVAKNGVATAVAALPAIRSGVIFAIAGEGPEEAELKAGAERLGVGSRILWLGAVDHADAPKYFRACDVVLIPSVAMDGIEEATSLAMLEGFACAKWVIASSIGGLREVMGEHALGELVPENDPSALAKAVNGFFADPSSQSPRILRGLKVAQELYGHRRWAETFERFVLGTPVVRSRRLALLGAAHSAHLIRLCNELLAQGWTITLFTQHDFDETEYHPAIQIHRLRFSGLAGYFLNGWQLRRALRASSVELLNVHYAGGYGVLALISFFRPTLLHVWGSDVVDLSQRNPLRRWLTQRVLASAREIVTTSGYLAEHLQQETGLDSRVVPFGVDTRRFRASDTGPRSFQVLCPKEMAAIYNQGFLIDVIHRLTEMFSREDLRARGFVVGLTGAANVYRKRVMEKARRLGVDEFVRLDGKIGYKDMNSYLGAAAIVVLPSMRESFGVAALEAGAVEAPVLAHRTGGLTEIVVDGETGWLLPLEAGLWAEKIAALMADDGMRRRMGTNGRRRVFDNFEIRKTSALLSSNYRRLL